MTLPRDATVFFDRSPACTLALSRYLGFTTSRLLAGEVSRMTAEGRYETTAFLIRNQGFVTATAARRISFEDSTPSAGIPRTRVRACRRASRPARRPRRPDHADHFDGTRTRSGSTTPVSLRRNLLELTGSVIVLGMSEQADDLERRIDRLRTDLRSAVHAAARDRVRALRADLRAAEQAWHALFDSDQDTELEQASADDGTAKNGTAKNGAAANSTYAVYQTLLPSASRCMRRSASSRSRRRRS